MQNHTVFIFVGIAVTVLAWYIVNFILKVSSVAEEEQEKY